MRMLATLLFGICFGAQPLLASDTSRPGMAADQEGLAGVISLQNWQGDYQVLCNNGQGEVIDDVDIRLDNACPRLDPNRSTGILTIHQQVDGSFDVMCEDLTRHVATADDVVAAALCESHRVFAEGVHDSHNGQADGNGNFSFICADGSRETVTPVNLRLDNFCQGVADPVAPYNYLAWSQNEDGTVRVHCADLERHEAATLDDVRGGELCEPVAPPVALQEGNFVPDSSSGFFCSIYRVSNAVYDSDSLRSFHVHCDTTGPWTFSCNGSLTCAGPGGRSITVEDPQTIRYTSSGNTTRMRLRS